MADARDASEPPPTLATLTVTLEGADGAAPDAAAGQTLTPPFASGIHDYYVRCAAGDNPMRVTMTAAAGAEASLSAPVTTPAKKSQDLTVSVAEGRAIVAVVSDGRASAQYWVRCLPHDFPRYTWSEPSPAGPPSPGYYLLGTTRPGGSTSSYAFAVDENGVPVWFYAPPGGAPGPGIYNVESLLNGHVSFIALPGPGFDWITLAPPGLSFVGPPSISLDEHDLRRLPNGHFLAIESPLQSGVNLSGLVQPLTDGGSLTLSGTYTVIACNVLDIAPDGSVTWSWRAIDHLDPRFDTTWAEPTASGNAFNVFHCNSLDIDPANGNFLVSARQMNSVFYVDRATSRILWKMGGQPYTKDNAVYVSVDDPFVCQHDARLEPGWKETCTGAAGQVSVFDDETMPAKNARAALYDVAIGTLDGGSTCAGDAGLTADSGTAKLVYQHAGVTVSAAEGSFRIQPDGARVIGWGTQKPNTGFTEIDSAGRVRAAFEFTDGTDSYRAIKVEPSGLSIDAMRATAGGTF